MLARRLRGGARPLASRAASGPALGVLRPLCEVLADGPDDTGTRKRGPKLRHWLARPVPRAATERREASALHPSAPTPPRGWLAPRGAPSPLALSLTQNRE